MNDNKVDRDIWALQVTADALDLVTELWPKPSYASVTIESHQWDRLRKVLLAVPELGGLA